ncbi:MAG TPA: hypothetical protein VI385_15005 [Flavisolibacter sp.]
MIFVYPTEEICVQKPGPVKAQTEYFSLVLANIGLLVGSLAVVAILIAALTFVVWLKQAGSKLS